MKSSTNWLAELKWGNSELESLRFLGYSYVRQGQYDIALVFFEVLEILSPEPCYELQTLGAIYLQKGNYLESLNCLDQALKIDPKHDPSHLNRMKALFFLGYKKQAMAQAVLLLQSKDRVIAEEARAFVETHS